MSWIKNTFEISHTNHKVNTSMEGIRGFAVFLVFLAHYVSLIDPWINEHSTTFLIAKYIHSIGNVGVDLFFVLSGYLIYGMLIKKEKPFKVYFIRRIQRIYPTFTAVFIIYFFLSILFPTESKIPNDWNKGALFLVQNYLLLPGMFDVKAMITVAWSLSYEFFYYLLIPLLIAILKLRSWNANYRIIFFILASIIFFVYFAIYGGHIRLLMFVSGILLFETVDSKSIKRIPPVGLPALILAILSVILLNEFNVNGWCKFALLYILFYLFCLECFLSSGFTNNLFSISYLRWLGNMSYSYYLIHGLALKFVFLLIDKIYLAQHSDVWFFWLFLPVAFFLTLLPSTVLFVYIEKPYSLVRNSTK